ncbi:hypothetical protein DSO57_1039360, partial [Entomophthora muscae]
VSALENPTPTTDWYNSSPDDAHQKESLAHEWFKYPSDIGDLLSTWLFQFYVWEIFAYLGHLGHLTVVTVSIGLVFSMPAVYQSFGAPGGPEVSNNSQDAGHNSGKNYW